MIVKKLMVLVSIYAWIAVVVTHPNKEAIFLFPVYSPLTLGVVLFCSMRHIPLQNIYSIISRVGEDDL